MKKYYRVEVKCGHVGRGRCIIKYLYIAAETGKEAAFIARYHPRVKHDHSDAILNCEEIGKDEYLEGIRRNKDDLYFRLHNRNEQREYEKTHSDEIKEDHYYREKSRPNKKIRERVKGHGLPTKCFEDDYSEYAYLAA